MVPAMAMAAAGVAFFFHVGNFATCGYFAISADHASAAQSREAEKPNETHHALRSKSPAIRVPLELPQRDAVSNALRSASDISAIEFFFRTLERALGRDRRGLASTRDRS
jgi:hypothetical protein